jgi:hypothetical protein
MMTLRCTRKFLERLNLPEREASQSPSLANTLPTTTLGDWYATILFTRPAHLILAVSERSRLCLLLPARETNTLASRFPVEAAKLLRRIGASEEEIEREVQEMAPLLFASTKPITPKYLIPKTLNDTANDASDNTSSQRSVLGSMNDFTRMVKVSLQLSDYSSDGSLQDLSEQMCETPCGPLKMRSPKEVACELLREL